MCPIKKIRKTYQSCENDEQRELVKKFAYNYVKKNKIRMAWYYFAICDDKSHSMMMKADLARNLRSCW